MFFAFLATAVFLSFAGEVTNGQCYQSILTPGYNFGNEVDIGLSVILTASPFGFPRRGSEVLVGESFDAGCEDNMLPWVLDHVQMDGDLARRWEGGNLDLTRQLPADPRRARQLE